MRGVYPNGVSCLSVDKEPRRAFELVEARVIPTGERRLPCRVRAAGDVGGGGVYTVRRPIAVAAPPAGLLVPTVTVITVGRIVGRGVAGAALHASRRRCSARCARRRRVRVLCGEGRVKVAHVERLCGRRAADEGRTEGGSVAPRGDPLKVERTEERRLA